MGSALDAHIVMRLCTDDESTVEFYNDVDNEVEMSLEVLDDLASEAEELRKVGNGWLTYSPLLHRVREGGCFYKLLDLLDERPLLQPEVYLLVQLMLQQHDQDQLPREPELLCKEVDRRVKSMDKVYNPLTKRLEPPINMRELRKALRVAPRWMQCFPVSAQQAICNIL